MYAVSASNYDCVRLAKVGGCSKTIRARQYERQAFSSRVNVPERRNTIPTIAKPQPQPQPSVDRQQLLGSATQQMRAPLTTMQLQLQLITRSLNRSPQLLASQLTPRLQVLQSQSRRLADMVEAAEDLARILAGEIVPDLHAVPVDLGRLVETIVEEHSEQAREQGCELRTTTEQVVWGEWDPARVRRIIASLLHNALLFAPKNPVSITTLLSSDNFGCVEVRDQGPGIAQSELRRLEPNAPAPSRTQTGAGWGLWLSAQLARAMGGRLEGRRPSAGGSVFVLSLPLTPAEAPQRP